MPIPLAIVLDEDFFPCESSSETFVVLVMFVSEVSCEVCVSVFCEDERESLVSFPQLIKHNVEIIRLFFYAA